MGSYVRNSTFAWLLLLLGCTDSTADNATDTGRLHGSTDDGGILLSGARDGGVPDASLPCGTFALTPGATYPAESGVYYELDHGGMRRQFKIHVPSSYRNGTPTPVLYAFHGMTGNAESFGIRGTGLGAKADAAGFLLVLPNGYRQSWNAGDCCGRAQKEGVDDIGFVRAVHERLRTELGLCVDPSRVYATGYSNGAILAYRLACEASDLFSAVASVSGTLAIPRDRCGEEMTRPVPFLEIHGILDKITPLVGTNGKGAAASVAALAGFDGCATTTAAATVPPSVLDTRCQTYTGCGTSAEVTLCEAANGGHCWFGSETCGTGSPYTFFLGGNANGIVSTDAVWSFVSRFRCATCGR